MKMTRGYIYDKLSKMLWIMAFGMVMAACSSDGTTPDIPDDQPETPQEGIDLSVSTRTVSIDDDYVIPEGAKLWLALTSGIDVSSTGTYKYNISSKWDPFLAAKVWETQSYYLYGALLPSDNAACSVTTNTVFSQDAVLTINGVEPVAKSGNDPLVIVGVQGVTDPETTWGVTEGHFEYVGQKIEGQDNVHLLLDHLYTALSFSFSIDADYAKLRTIKLKKIELTSNLTKKLNLTINLTTGNSGVTPITSVTATAGTDDASTTTSPVVLFDVSVDNDESNNDGVDISSLGSGTTATQAISASCFFPSVISNLSLICTYDVYDKASQLLGTRKAVNSLSSVTSGTRGEIKNINLNVVPTYLYILSDNDLDNPTLKISSN